MILSPSSQTIDHLVSCLEQGLLIGLPTETVYGLAGIATLDRAVAQIFALKGRPSFNPLIVHGGTIRILQEHTLWDDRAERLAHAFWPGPLTLILPRDEKASLSYLTSAGLPSVAVRIPSHPIALKILKILGQPVAAPSANISGKVSPTQAHHVAQDFPRLPIMDGGNASIGLESTIIDLTGEVPLLLRPGPILLEDLEKFLGPIGLPGGKLPIKAPGMLTSHYAPLLPVRLKVKEPEPGEAYLAFGITSHNGDHVLNLSPKGDLIEAAANLFQMLRTLDNEIFTGIAVAPIPFEGLGLAINDRLERAAAPRNPEER